MSTFKINLPAGPIWSHEDAQIKAPAVAAAHQGTWTGQWTTIKESEMSVVEVTLNIKNTGTNEYVTKVPAGPLWTNDEAQKIGPAIAASYGATFTGEWETIIEGVMSVIEVKYTF